MPYSKHERTLLKRLAEVYAFLVDLRRQAAASGDRQYVRLTEGIDEKVRYYRKKYSPAFGRYYNAAARSARQYREKSKTDGKRKEVSRRQKEAQEHKTREASRKNNNHQKKPHRKKNKLE